MPLLPSRTKYRKVQKGRVRGKAKGGDYLAFGEFGIQTLDRGRMTARQVEKPHLLSEIRRDLARLQTILNEKKTAEAKSAA